MRILDRYIVREVSRHAFLGLVVFTFVFLVPRLVRLMEIYVRHVGSGAQILELFLCIFPGVFVFTVPMATLIGVLLGLGRMSADSEIIALTSLGIGRRRILFPVGVLALVGALLTLVMTTWVGPGALRTLHTAEAQLISSQISFQLQPRVFDERFPKKVLYVNDVSASGTQWHGVFVADTGGEGGSQVTLADSAIVIAEPKQGKLELHLKGGTTHEFSREDPNHYAVTSFGQSDWPIQVSGLGSVQPRHRSIPEQSMKELMTERRSGSREASVELETRLAFPVACLVFALVAVPLGAQPRRGGRAAGSLLAVVLIAAYYLLLILGAGLAREGKISPAAGIWMANGILTALGIALLPRMEQFRGESRWLRPLGYLSRRIRLARRRKAQARARAAAAQAANGERGAQEMPARSSGSFPRLMDLYTLRKFFFYFGLLLAIFVFLFEAFTFFELLDDIGRRRIAFVTVAEYFGYLTPYLVYNLAPLAGLVAVLVTLVAIVVRPGSSTVPVVGDSITFFAGRDISGALGSGYHADVHAGIGKRIDEMLTTVRDVMRDHPLAVVVDLGTNDALQAQTHPDWQTGFHRLIAVLSPAQCVVLTTINTLVDGRSGGLLVASAINSAIAAVASRHRNFHVVDWNAAVHRVDGANLLMADQIHPSAAGQLTLAALVRTALVHDCLHP